ncbi:MAG: hypothetical protein NVS1B4_02820 [Gemmatimonadaceae bacterium]
MIYTLLFVGQALQIGGVTHDSVPLPSHVPEVIAVRAARAPIIDGHLTDAAWHDAPVVSDFQQQNPSEGEAATERTEVRIVYDDDALYVGARLFQRDPKQIREALTRRDVRAPSDRFTVALDTYHDHQTAMIFSVNPSGVRSDRIAGRDQSEGDDSWDPVWEAAVSVDSGGWTAEVRIPFSQLRFPPDDVQTWGINFFRRLSRRNENDAFVLVRQNEKGYASRFGHLIGLRRIPSPKRLELRPYTSAQLQSRRAVAGNPFFRGEEITRSAGFDLKYGLTSNLTVDATINPDFGQVEADPAQLNLTVFETFLEERRPFFVEGAQIFAFGAGADAHGAPGEVFYSRRIGRSPSLSPTLVAARAAGDSVVGPFTSAASNAPIIAAAKISGRLASGTSLGLLHAETGRVLGSIYAEQLYGRRVTSPSGDRAFIVDRRVPVRYDDEIEPRGGQSVVRITQDFRGGQSSIGMLYTLTQRDLDTPRVDSLFRRSARVLGVDWHHRWGDERFNFTGNAVWSDIRGSHSAMTRVQRASARYYQRPDQNYVGVDTTLTALDGGSATAKLRYDGPQGLGASLGGNVTTPGYELNDLGYLTQADIRTLFASASLATPKPTKRFRRVTVEGGGNSNWNSGGERIGGRAFLSVASELQNDWRAHVNVGVGGWGINRAATRGGPAVLTSPNRSVLMTVRSDPRRLFSASIHGSASRTDFGTHHEGGQFFLTWRPRSDAELGIGVHYNTGTELGYVVASVPDTLARNTFGRRYVFSALEQSTLSGSIRANITFTPALTAQVYAEPFTSGATASNFRELLRPHSFDFSYYASDPRAQVVRENGGDYRVTLSQVPGGPPVTSFTVSNPDRRYRSLRGSAVLRWEYRPGATLFAVWTHSRGLGDGAGYGGLSDLRSLLGLAPENVALVKINYWLSR